VDDAIPQTTVRHPSDTRQQLYLSSESAAPVASWSRIRDARWVLTAERFMFERVSNTSVTARAYTGPTKS
jgi:hypothetical protein